MKIDIYSGFLGAGKTTLIKKMISEAYKGQKLIVDTGNVAGFSSTVQMDIQTVPGVKNALFGGEGLFNTVLTGPGRVWLQTMPISNVANAIRPYIPTGNNN